MTTWQKLAGLYQRWNSAMSALSADPQELSVFQARDWLRAAIDAMPEGIVFLDPEDRYILWNQRYAEIYNKSADLFKPGARLADTLRIGVERGGYPEALGRERRVDRRTPGETRKAARRA